MKLKEIRAARGLSGAALSKLSGVPLRTIEDIERRGDCRLSTARQLCDALGISLDVLHPPERPLAQVEIEVELPAWMDAKATALGLDLSQILTEALLTLIPLED